MYGLMTTSGTDGGRNPGVSTSKSSSPAVAHSDAAGSAWKQTNEIATQSVQYMVYDTDAIANLIMSRPMQANAAWLCTQ